VASSLFLVRVAPDLGQAVIFASVWLEKREASPMGESVRGVSECSLAAEELSMVTALTVVLFAVLVLGPCVLAAMVDLDSSVPK
jgi:hypothetical protein